jgi:hypothetical protein
MVSYRLKFIYLAQKDACGQSILNSPACCTNEIFNSYAITLGNDLKKLSDTKLTELKNLLFASNQEIDCKFNDFNSIQSINLFNHI